MRTWRAFVASLIVAFVVLSVLADGNATTHIVTGTVAGFQAGEWISVVNDQTGPVGHPIALRDTTVYEGRDHHSALVPVIKPGVRVTVWYRNVSERRHVADKVRVLPNAATR
jgi:hypothetical protein